MQTAKQFSVQLVNKPGRLSAVLTALTKEKVGMRAFSVMDSGTRGTLRFVPDKPEQVQQVLEAINVKCEEADVLLAEVNSQSGGLPKICQRLAEEHLNVDYAYGSLSAVRGKGTSLAVIRVNDLSKAQKVLSESLSSGNSKSRKRPGRRPAFAR